MKRKLLWLGCCMLGAFGLLSAQDGRVPGELIVHLEESVDARRWLSQVASARAAGTLRYGQALGRRHNLHLLRFSETEVKAEELLVLIRRLPGLRAVQFNYALEFRRFPNDTLYPQQWSMETLQARDVWEVSTGGTTPDGHAIVVAIVDRGFEPEHPDIAPNLWHNAEEVPADGIDNDGNGYIDDEIGWNFLEDSPVLNHHHHGLGAAGIIGAKGNNSLGIAGINWDLQMMQFSSLLVSDIIEAYEYVIDQRARYNETRGAAGAFVVATNASFGQDRVFCDEQPVWAGMYDLLGEVGILTAVAPANSPIDVEVLGDMPTTCTTPYIITVCNTDADDELSQSSAYGAVSVDVGAPGSNTFTAFLEGAYGGFSGNSAAAPHVTGAIALLYSLPCAGLSRQAMEQPAETALLMREAILNGVDPLPSLQGKTVTGGRLNLFGSMQYLQSLCGNENGDLELTVFPNPAEEWVTVSYVAPDFDPLTLQVYNSLGQLVYEESLTPPRFGEWRLDFSVRHWPVGTYFIRLGRGQSTVVEKLLVYRTR